MMKTVRLSEIGRIFTNKKFKKVSKDNWIYDYKWRIAFKTKKYRQEFLDTIKRAEEEIERGDGISFEEFEKEIKNWIY
ncbi:MAG: hypothetical protein HFJ40_06925 [Clostridia bacterium]|nr:hypothetical protein [Clostridia bacterium]